MSRSRRSARGPSGLENRTTLDLLGGYVNILEELRERGAIRSTNNPAADYAEYLASRALSLRLAPKSTRGYDATDSRDKRYEIKGRRPTRHNPSRQLSVIRGLDKKQFDYLIGVLFAEQFTVERACVIPSGVVRDLAVYRPYVNGWILHLRDTVWQQTGVQDITRRLKSLEESYS